MSVKIASSINTPHAKTVRFTINGKAFARSFSADLNDAEIVKKLEAEFKKDKK